jgi:hypothetical protein
VVVVRKGWWAGWNTFLAFFSMEFVQWRRVNGMSALLTLVACAVDWRHQADDACVAIAVICFALYSYHNYPQVWNGITHLFSPRAPEYHTTLKHDLIKVIKKP